MEVCKKKYASADLQCAECAAVVYMTPFLPLSATVRRAAFVLRLKPLFQCDDAIINLQLM